jgi:hypothetical protein
MTALRSVCVEADRAPLPPAPYPSRLVAAAARLDAGAATAILRSSPLSAMPSPAVIAAGPGWHATAIPERVPRPLDLGGTVPAALAPV